MLPYYNSYPRGPNQAEQTNAPTGPPPQQAMPSNPSLANSLGLVQNALQFQPHFGMNNAQAQVFFSNSNSPLNLNVRPPINQHGFMNAPNHIFPLQNTQLGMSHLGSQLGQSHVGFGAQNKLCNINPVAGFLGNGQFCNLAQNVNQSHASQLSLVPNFPQQLNPNMVLPNGQYVFPNMFQSMNQLLPLQMQASSQAGPHGIPPYTLGGLNHPPNATIPQNANFLANQQFGLVHANKVGQQDNQNQQHLALTATDANGLQPSPIATPQLQGSSSGHSTHYPVLPQHSNNFQTSVQGNPTNNGVVNVASSNWKNSPGKNFTRNPKRGAPQEGSQKSQFHHMKNARGKFGYPNEHKGKGFSNERTKRIDHANSTNQARGQKRSLSLTYTEQEIRQWREARRKNFPTNANIIKKQVGELADSEGNAKLRKAQLKEILAKQAELGVEVAEVPSYYLSDSEKQGHGREDDRRPLTKKERFQNKFKKRGRYDKRDRFAKKQRLAERDTSTDASLNKPKPTLLQKLLSADIGRDKSRLLQVFRFMVMNSFFKDWPDKPLRFPLVLVKESACEDEAVEKSSPVGKEAEGSILTMAKELNHDNNNGEEEEKEEESDNDDNEDDDDNDDNDEHGRPVKEASNFVERKDSIGEGAVIAEEEEGEIID